MKKMGMIEKHSRKGIYILPNLFTTAALFAGFYAIVQSMNGQFEYAPAAIFIAMIMDGMDGRVARWTHTESDFGAQYDSLSDMVSFGLAPSLVMYEWALSGLGKAGWLAAFLYAACAALRLARFNVQHGTVDKRYFVGLPSPSAAALTMGLVWVMHSYGVPGRELSLVALGFTIFAGVAMVSNIRYFSFKQFSVKERAPFVAIILVVLVFMLLATETATVLFTIFLGYALSGPLAALWRMNKRGQQRRSAETGRRL
jgi:CDP-diacylglycerol--serine O-phosphatidyltransferase